MKNRTLLIVLAIVVVLAVVVVKTRGGGGFMRSLGTMVHGTALFVTLEAQSKPPSVAGKWTLEAPDGPHGAMTMTLVLEQKDTAVTGTLNIPHAGDIRMTGTFDGTKLSMAADAGSDHAGITLSATLKQTTLTGFISSERGDVKWTGTRK